MTRTTRQRAGNFVRLTHHPARSSSSRQRAPVPTLWALHRQSEEQIEQSGLRFTHLRPDACLQNILMFSAAIATGVYPAPTGEGRRAWVDVRDVAAVSAVVLTEPGHDNCSYELTGPEALFDDDIAVKISSATGREVKPLPLSWTVWSKRLCATASCRRVMENVFRELPRSS
jgi:uncharacterized protein YbjT (DUF2867 family)